MNRPSCYRTQAAKFADSNPVMRFLAIPMGDDVSVHSDYPYVLGFPDKSIVMYDGDDANPVCYVPGSTL